MFYFVAPHRIKDIDKEFIKTLNGLAPMVLVVAKADTMTLQERRKHLENVFAMMKELKEICEHPIVFDFEEDGDSFIDDQMELPVPPAAEAMVESDQEDRVEQDRVIVPTHTETFRAAAEQDHACLKAEHVQLHVPLPRIRNVFAVVCDTSESGKREYPWGSLNIYDEEHSDFRRLQRVVLEGEKITELIEQTQMMSLRIYKNTAAASKVGGMAAVSADTPTTTVTAPPQPSTPVQQAMAVFYRVKAALDTGIITLFYAMLPLLLWILVFGGMK